MTTFICSGFTHGTQQLILSWDGSVCLTQAIITLILATDMARHGEILDSFKQKVDNFDFTNEEHVTCVCTVFSVPIQFPILTLHWFTGLDHRS